MNKGLILAVLFVPSFGHSISKEEQIKQLKNELHAINVKITQLNESLAYEAILSFFGGKDESVTKPIVKELRNHQKQLQKIKSQLLKLGVKDTDENLDSKTNTCCCPETCNNCCKEANHE